VTGLMYELQIKNQVSVNVIILFYLCLWNNA